MSVLAQLMESGGQCGFDNCAPVDTGDIIFDAELRKNCEMNSCGDYGRNWVCPPHCGDIEDCIARARQFDHAVVVQYIGTLEDSYDFEGMVEAARAFEIKFEQFARQARQISDDIYPLGAGGCHRCARCAVLDDAPCRHLDIAYPSLESHGIYVADLAAKSGMKYINGPNTVTYFGAVFYKETQ